MEFRLTPSQPKIKSVLAVLSGKGGVGKSTTAALLASGLHHRGLNVGVLDADITGASIPKLFGVREPPLQNAAGKIIPRMSKGGIEIMSVNLMLPNEDDAVIWRGPLISKMIQQFWNDVAWGPLDALVVDLPPGTSDAALTVMQNLPITGVIVVTTPQDLADLIVRKAANMTRIVDKPLLGVVENMSYAVCPHCGKRFNLFGGGHAESLATSFDIPLLGRIGLDPRLAQACDNGNIEQFRSADFEPIVEAIQRSVAELKDRA